jgi:hypothetical protein
MRHRLVIGVSRNFSIVAGISPHQWRSKMHRHKRIAAGFASLALLVGLAAAACTQPGASASPSAMMAMKPVGHDGEPVRDDGEPVGHDGEPVGDDGEPVGHDGEPVGHDGKPVADRQVARIPALPCSLTGRPRTPR